MPTKAGELREMLITTIEDVRAGRISPDKAKAVAMLAQQVNSSLQDEVNVVKEARALGLIKKGATVTTEELGSLSLGETLRLGNGDN